MNQDIQQILEFGTSPLNLVIGLMSGTSLDGLDVAICEITGKGENTNVRVIHFETIDYPPTLKNMLSEVAFKSRVKLQDVCLLNSQLGDFYGESVLSSLQKWRVDPADIACVASHGQTIYHAPKRNHQKSDFGNATLQIGDGDHIAQKTGILTLSDFRQKHTAVGGEGAPLAALIDELLFRDDEEYRLLLNIGGIANFTLLPPKRSDEEVITSDTGPGNTLMNAVAQKYLHRPFDRNGEKAARGRINKKLLHELKDDEFFEASLPKTTGPELFNLAYLKKAEKQSATGNIPAEDLLTTLVFFTATTISEAVEKVHASAKKLKLYVSGGGIHNDFLMERLRAELEHVEIHSFEEIGFNPDAKEAAYFAVLANECIKGDGFYLDEYSENRRLHFGKISMPN